MNTGVGVRGEGEMRRYSDGRKIHSVVQEALYGEEKFLFPYTARALELPLSRSAGVSIVVPAFCKIKLRYRCAGARWGRYPYR